LKVVKKSNKINVRNMTETKNNSSDKEVKVFKDLFETIIHPGLCCSCGACVAYCESQGFNVIKMEGYKPRYKSPETVENCTECGLCYFICPQTDTIQEKMNNFYQIKDELGYIKDILAAKTTEKAIEEVGQDGGVVTTILSYLFDKHMIDAAIVSQYDVNFNTIPKIIYDKDDLLKSSGTRYSISSQILPLKDLYNLSLEIIEKKGIFDIEQLRLAFIGTPCQTRAIEKMRFLHVKPAHVIKYSISLFCFENFDYEKLYKILKDETNVEAKNIKKTWIKKNFFLKNKEDKEFEVDIKKLDSAVRNHCHVCDEFTGRFSDISVGATGAPSGYSMIITRNEKAHNLISSLLSEGLIEQYLVPVEKTKEWKEKKIAWLKKMVSLKTKK
jgi:coenzyme F420 hydrogenase subunit beta